MRHLITAAAALAVCGFFATSSAIAEPLFDPGGPVKVGSSCKYMTNNIGGMDAGYYGPCADEPVKVAKRTKKQKS